MMSKNPIPAGTFPIAPATVRPNSQDLSRKRWLTLPLTLQMVNNHRPRLRCTCVAGGLGLFTQRGEQYVRTCCSWSCSTWPRLKTHITTGSAMAGSTLDEGEGQLWKKRTLDFPSSPLFESTSPKHIVVLVRRCHTGMM
jgi:hypothetical protein